MEGKTDPACRRGVRAKTFDVQKKKVETVPVEAGVVPALNGAR